MGCPRRVALKRSGCTPSAGSPAGAGLTLSILAIFVMTKTYHESGNIDEAAIRVVGEAGTGFEALHQVRIHKPDALLLDIEMPDLNGVEAVGPGVPELI